MPVFLIQYRLIYVFGKFSIPSSKTWGQNGFLNLVELLVPRTDKYILKFPSSKLMGINALGSTSFLCCSLLTDLASVLPFYLPPYIPRVIRDDTYFVSFDRVLSSLVFGLAHRHAQLYVIVYWSMICWMGLAIKFLILYIFLAIVATSHSSRRSLLWKVLIWRRHKTQDLLWSLFFVLYRRQSCLQIA